MMQDARHGDAQCGVQLPRLGHIDHRVAATCRIGEPVDGHESERIEWVPLANISKLIEQGQVVSGTTLAVLLYVLTKTMPPQTL
jgi:hypothetical protein